MGRVFDYLDVRALEKTEKDLLEKLYNIDQELIQVRAALAKLRIRQRGR